MKRKHGSFYLVGLSVALGLCLVSGIAMADNVAWDLVSSSSQNLVSYSTDAPDFGNPGDGFQKYTAVQQACPPPPDPNLNNIPYALVDDSACIYPTDIGGIIDSMTDFDEFFGVCDTVNDVNSDFVNATWVFDISSAVDTVELHIDLAAMGNFEDPEDVFEWSYQVDGGAVQPILTAVADEGNSLSYTLASGTIVDLSDPLVVDGVTLSNFFQTFTTPITTGSQLTVVFTALTDGGSEGYAARNILVTGTTDQPPGGGEPIPTLSMTGIAAMVLLLIAGAVILFRRLR